MPTQNEIELAKAVHALTESLSMSFKLQAQTWRVLADLHPNHATNFRLVADGAEQSALNLVRHLPKIPTD